MRKARDIKAFFGLFFACFFFTTSCRESTVSNDHTQTVVVFAAASLKDVLNELALDFESIRPDVDVQLAVAGSQVLRMQIEHGAKANIFASANKMHVQSLITLNKMSQHQPLAYNELSLIVAQGNPAEIDDLSSIGNARRIVIGSKGAPIGEYTETLFKNMEKRWGSQFVDSLKKKVVSKESNARLVRSRVEMGEADAAIVYKTDAMSAKNVNRIEIPEDLNVRVELSIGKIIAPRSNDATDDFVSHIFSARGRETLERNGFVLVQK